MLIEMPDLQNRIFTAYFVVVFPPAIVNSVVPKFFENRMIWEARELPSRIYGWVPFCTAHAVAEIPSAVVTTVIYYLLWYFPSGQPTDIATSGFVSPHFSWRLLSYSQNNRCSS